MGDGDVAPKGGVALPLLHHQAVQAAVRQGQVQECGVWEILHEVAEHKGGKVLQANWNVRSLPSYSGRVQTLGVLPHTLDRLDGAAKFPFGTFSTRKAAGGGNGLNKSDHNSGEALQSEGGVFPFASCHSSHVKEHGYSTHSENSDILMTLFGTAIARNHGSDERLATRLLFQRLSLTLMRGNAALIVGRKPDADFVGAEVDGVI